jgi:hypothetical protein
MGRASLVVGSFLPGVFSSEYPKISSSLRNLDRINLIWINQTDDEIKTWREGSDDGDNENM